MRSELIKQMERGNDIAAASLPEEAGSLRAVELTTDADFEYVTALGGVVQANAEILSVLNMVEPVYETQLGVTFTITMQHTWTTADPFTGANDDAFVRNLAAWWEQNFPRAQNPRDAMHLFTGDADKLARGFAFIGVVCRVPSLATVSAVMSTGHRANFCSPPTRWGIISALITCRLRMGRIARTP